MTTTTPPEGILLTVEDAQKLVDFLVTRSYKEVFQLLPLLLRAKPGWGKSEPTPLLPEKKKAS